MYQLIHAYTANFKCTHRIVNLDVTLDVCCELGRGWLVVITSRRRFTFLRQVGGGWVHPKDSGNEAQVKRLSLEF